MLHAPTALHCSAWHRQWLAGTPLTFPSLTCHTSTSTRLGACLPSLVVSDAVRQAATQSFLPKMSTNRTVGGLRCACKQPANNLLQHR